MGMSTDAILCFGVTVVGDSQVPWSDREIEDWWMTDVCGYKPPFEIYDEEGDYLNGISDEQIGSYYRASDKFLGENPLPVEVVQHCSPDDYMWMITVPGTVQTAYRGYPKVAKVETPDHDDILKLIGFCDEYDIECIEQPTWLLASWFSM